MKTPPIAHCPGTQSRRDWKPPLSSPMTLDARESFGNTVAYAQLEKHHGVQSTFFINTKTLTDESDIGYYDAARIPFLIEIRQLGFELGSHSVSHSKKFNKFPMGTALITAATYQPAKSPTVL